MHLNEIHFALHGNFGGFGDASGEESAVSADGVFPLEFDQEIEAADVDGSEHEGANVAIGVGRNENIFGLLGRRKIGRSDFDGDLERLGLADGADGKNHLEGARADVFGTSFVFFFLKDAEETNHRGHGEFWGLVELWWKHSQE
jgi:hypothetical protein